MSVTLAAPQTASEDDTAAQLLQHGNSEESTTTTLPPPDPTTIVADDEAEAVMPDGPKLPPTIQPYYEFSETAGNVEKWRCALCQNIYTRHNGSTGNLWRHLKHVHQTSITDAPSSPVKSEVKMSQQQSSSAASANRRRPGRPKGSNAASKAGAGKTTTRDPNPAPPPTQAPTNDDEMPNLDVAKFFELHLPEGEPESKAKWRCLVCNHTLSRLPRTISNLWRHMRKNHAEKLQEEEMNSLIAEANGHHPSATATTSRKRPVSSLYSTMPTAAGVDTFHQANANATASSPFFNISSQKQRPPPPPPQTVACERTSCIIVKSAASTVVQGVAAIKAELQRLASGNDQEDDDQEQEEEQPKQKSLAKRRRDSTMLLLPRVLADESNGLQQLRQLLPTEAIQLDSDGTIWEIETDAVTVLSQLTSLGFVTAAAMSDASSGEYTWTLVGSK